MAKRIFGLAVFPTMTGLPEELLTFCAANGWEIELSLPYGSTSTFTQPDMIAFYTQAIQNIIDRGIPVWLEIEALIYYGGATVDTTPEQLQTTYGAALVEYEKLGPLFKGYAFEGGYDNALIWLKQYSKKKLLGHWLTGYYNAFNSGAPDYKPTNVVEWGTHDMTWRVNQLDEIAMEIYQIDWCEIIPYFKAWLDTVAPGKPFGILTGLEINGGYWWNQDMHNSGNLYTYEQEKALLTQWCNWLKTQIGAFDGIVFDPGTQDAALTNSELTYIDSLKLVKDGGDPMAYTYSWNFGDGATSTVAAPAHTYTTPGTYAVTLSVTDSSDGAVGSATMNMIVKRVLTVTLTANPTTVAIGKPVTFTATVS